MAITQSQFQVQNRPVVCRPARRLRDAMPAGPPGRAHGVELHDEGRDLLVLEERRKIKLRRNPVRAASPAIRRLPVVI
jgi:hypothetical protein